MNLQRLACTLFMMTTMALAGCGGGGGSMSPMDQMGGNGGVGTPDDMMPNGGATTELTESQLYGDIARYSEVAANDPVFGSITQSSNGNGISTDRVETTLDANGDLTVIVRDGNGAVSLELDSRQHEHTDLNGTAWMDDGDEDFPQNWSGNGWVLSKQDGNDVVVALAYTAWNNTDVTDYLAGGYWIKGNEAEGVTEMGTFGDAGSGSVFAYYDGQDSSWQRPITGTATYLGEAEGAYVDSDGEAGVWWSRLMLSADFATNSISGCVGCPQADPARDDRGIYTYTTIDDLKNDQWYEEDLYVELLGNGNINNDGSFKGTLKVLELSTNNELDSEGKWGGLFSENSDAAAHPSQAVGTLGGTAEGSGFIGVFQGQGQ